MKYWEAFVESLESVPWTNLSDDVLNHLARTVRLAASHTDEILSRFADVISDGHLFKEYAPHIEYPRPLMNKFVLYIDPSDRFRIRLHQFKAEDENRGITPWIHDHRWHFISVVLSGSYVETRYSVSAEDDAARRAQLEVVDTRRLMPGDVNICVPRVPHLTVNDSKHMACYTLFVRGPSFHEYSRIFDQANGTFKPSWGLKQELLAELTKMQDQLAIRQRPIGH